MEANVDTCFAGYAAKNIGNKEKKVWCYAMDGHWDLCRINC